MISKDTKAFLIIFWKEHVNRYKHLNRISNIKHKIYHEWHIATNLKQKYAVNVFEICTKR
jgi:hypothetical protein